MKTTKYLIRLLSKCRCIVIYLYVLNNSYVHGPVGGKIYVGEIVEFLYVYNSGCKHRFIGLVSLGTKNTWATSPLLF